MIAVQQAENLKVYVTDKKNGKTEPYDNGGVNGRNRGKADELISELLPKNLSSYCCTAIICGNLRENIAFLTILYS